MWRWWHIHPAMVGCLDGLKPLEGQGMMAYSDIFWWESYDIHSYPFISYPQSQLSVIIPSTQTLPRGGVGRPLSSQNSWFSVHKLIDFQGWNMPEHFEDIDIEKLSKNRGRARSQTKASNAVGEVEQQRQLVFFQLVPRKVRSALPGTSLSHDRAAWPLLKIGRVNSSTRINQRTWARILPWLQGWLAWRGCFRLGGLVSRPVEAMDGHRFRWLQIE